MVFTLNTGSFGVSNSNSFLLIIGVVLLSFSKVSNISRTLEYDTVVEGGMNTAVRTFTKPKQQQETLILEKGVNLIRGIDTFVYAGLNLKVGKKIRMPITLAVLGNRLYNDRFYIIDEGLVVKWEIGNLDAMSNEVLIERFEIAHSGLSELAMANLIF